MSQKKRLHELAKELDVTTDRLMDIAMRHGMRFSSNFNAVEPEQEEKLRTIVLGPIRKQTKPIVRIVKTAKQKQKEEEAARIAEEEALKEEEELEAYEEEAEYDDVVEEPAAELPDEPEEEVVEPEEQEEEPEPVEVVAEEEAPAEETVEEPAAAAAAPEEKEEVREHRGKRVKIVEKKAPIAPTPVRRIELPDERKATPKPAPAQKAAKPAVARPSHQAAPAGREAPPSHRKKKRKKKGREQQQATAPAPAATFTPLPGKKRQKMPDMPTVDHVMIMEGMTVKDLADKLGIKAKDIIQKLLMEKGVMATINHALDVETATEIAKGYDVSAEEVSFEEEIALEEELKVEGEAIIRAPVVTIMGHVDHGKTTLLDNIRKSRVAEGEHGGITQHIGAYKVMHKDKPIVFLDTPGHEAFTKLRARGAQVTDVIILIVAADDGVMPQTIESIQHARAAGVPMIVAITKSDRTQANPDKVKRGLSEQNVLVEDWGGDVVSVEVSGITGQGVDDLLEMILLVSEMQDLRAYPEVKGTGTVIEASLDRARGPVATVLVQNGTVRVGDFFIAGTTLGKIKAMFDDTGKKIDIVGPATPVEILGFNVVPESGDHFQSVDDEAKARQMVGFRQDQVREREMAKGARLSLDDLFSKMQQGEFHELPVIIKGDVKGSVEALADALEQQSTDVVKVNVLLSQPGAITESDVLLATASSAIIIGFNVRAQKGANALADKEDIEIRIYNVIYEVIKDIRDAMTGMLAPEIHEEIIGKAEVRQTFKVPKLGIIAGCYVIEGIMKRSAGARLIRDDIVVWEGKVHSLKRFKDDVREVKQDFECGIGLENNKDIREGDIIEMHIKKEVAAEL